MNNFNNWTVDFGFDGSKVFKGMNAIETKAKRLFTKLDQIKRAETSGSRSGSLLEKIEKTRSSREQSVAKSRKVVKSPVDKAKELNEVARLNSELKLQDKSIQLIRLRNKLTIAGATESSSVVSKLDDSLNSVKSSQELLNKVTKTGTKEYTEFQKEVLRTNSGIKNLSAEIRDSLTELRAADLAASARKRKPEPVIPTSRFNPLSDSAILSREFQIRNKINKLIEMRNKLDGQTSPEAKRLVDDLTSSISDLRSAQASLSKATNKNSKDFRDYEKSLGEVNLRMSRLNSRTNMVTNTLGSQKFASGALSSSLKNLARSYLSVFAVLGGAGAILKVGSQFQDLSSTMLLASKDAEEAGKNMEFLTKMSRDLGIDLIDTSKAFAKFNVAAAGQNVPLEQSKLDFMDLSIAIRATGLNAHEAGLAMLGFQQMLAGPTIQANEMNQVNERMPQFTGAAIKALREMGFEGDNYKKSIESGTVASVEFVSRVSRIMREQAINSGAFAASLESITAQIGKIRSELQLRVNDAFNAGLAEGASELMSSIIYFLEVSKPAWQNFGIILGAVFKILADMLDSISLLISGVSLLTSGVTHMVLELMKGDKAFDSTLKKLNEATEELGFWEKLLKRIILTVRVMGSHFSLIRAQFRLFKEELKEGFRVFTAEGPLAIFSGESRKKVSEELDKQVSKGRERAKVEINAPIEIKVEGAGNPETAAEMVDKKIRKVFTDLSSSFE